MCKKDSKILNYPTPLTHDEQLFYQDLKQNEASLLWLGHTRIVDTNGNWDWSEPIDWVTWRSHDLDNARDSEGKFISTQLYFTTTSLGITWGLTNHLSHPDETICTFVDRRPKLVKPCASSGRFITNF